ncbi:MAG: hypothetical protein B6I20_09235 [Bacteroidetes bacterium 4572_117]|nr:MAG: hypothetical protein B6I20_09235 [Bacteroidetes bacterium 4572_117]
MSEKNKNSSRRDFLQKLGVTGLGAIAASSALISGCSSEKSEGAKKVKLLTQDNKLVEVDSSHLASVENACQRVKMRTNCIQNNTISMFWKCGTKPARSITTCRKLANNAITRLVFLFALLMQLLNDKMG